MSRPGVRPPLPIARPVARPVAAVAKDVDSDVSALLVNVALAVGVTSAVGHDPRDAKTPSLRHCNSAPSSSAIFHRMARDLMSLSNR
jgi:hypothetical protein